MVKARSVRLSDKLLEALDRVAVAVDRPRSYLIRKAIEAYVGEYADDRVALKRLRDPKDDIITGRELRRRLGL